MIKIRPTGNLACICKLHVLEFSNTIDIGLNNPMLVVYIPKRFKYKPKWAVNTKTTNQNRALDHFDAFYKPYYGKLWPLLRVSLLSMAKHCAVLNKYSDSPKVSSLLERLGTENFVDFARNHMCELQAELRSLQGGNVIHPHPSFDDFGIPNKVTSKPGEILQDENVNEYERENMAPSKLDFVIDKDVLEPFDEDLYKDRLDVFVPTEAAVSNRDEVEQDEILMSTFQPREVHVEMLPPNAEVPDGNINAYIFPPSNPSQFPSAKAFSQRTGYYLMDAASVLPVLALAVRPSDRVLDLCAAPGGKSVLMLQSLDFEAGASLHCNDSSHSRLVRLKNVLASYLPPNVFSQVQVSQLDGNSFLEPFFDKVLVDVPCNTDRHVVQKHDNNLFAPVRTRERLQMTYVQRNLLVSAIKSCKVGGSVVYSTCTLAPAQNDGVVQAAIERIKEEASADVAVQDMSDLAEMFSSTFHFHGKCRYGQLVLPSLRNNSGPIYFAKLQRIK